MAANVNTYNDHPPPEADFVPSSFVCDQKMVDKVSERLKVHPEWVRQAIYFVQYRESEDEVCAYILENHPRFELVSTSSSSAEESMEHSSEFMMAFIVNAAEKMPQDKAAEQIAQAMLEFYSENLNSEDVKSWKEAGAHKVVLKCKDADDLYTRNMLAEAEDLNCYYINDTGYGTKGIGNVTVLIIFGKTSEVHEIIQDLSKLS